jgi:hypothetical protein
VFALLSLGTALLLLLTLVVVLVTNLGFFAVALVGLSVAVAGGMVGAHRTACWYPTAT